MGFDFSNARTRLDREYRSISGLKIEPEWDGWFEAYRDVFCEKLDSLGFTNEADFVALLVRMDEYNSVGEFLFDEDQQQAEMAAFGLVVFDRILRAEAANVSHSDVFSMHDALVECYGFEVRSCYRKNLSLRAADKRYKPNRKAQEFVRSEWSKHRDAYKGNKSDFARTYITLVRNEFSVEVTEKQLREVWLSDTPAAGKR